MPPSLIGLLVASLISISLFDPACTQIPEPVNRRFKINYLVLCALMLYLFCSQFMIGAPFGRYIGLLSALAFFPLTLMFLGRQTPEHVQVWADRFIRMAIALLVVECVWRFAMSFYQIQQGLSHTYGIYRFKTAGPMYSESNTTALHILVVLMFSFFWGDRQKQSYLKEKIILFALLILTFSRAGVLAAVLGIGFYFICRKWRFKTIVWTAVIVMGLLLATTLLFFSLGYAKDYSFLSKFYILFQAERYFANATLSEWIFGIGSSLSEIRLGIYSHSFFLTYLIETGLVGLLGILVLFSLFIYQTRVKGLLFLLPFLVMTLSSSTTYIPFFYTAMAMITWFTMNDKVHKA